MVKTSGLTFVADAYSPTAYNPNAFNPIVYTRAENHPELLFFPRPPAGGLSRLEQLLESVGAREFEGPKAQVAMAQGSLKEAVATARGDSPSPGAVVPFLESCYPLAVLFNTATGAWTSAQAQAAVAAADRSNVFRALESVPGQDAGAVVVESARGLDEAIRKVGGTSRTALVLSSIAPMCMEIRVVEVGALPAPPSDIYEAAVKTSPDHRLLVSPFVGLKAQQREICCDGIIVDGDVIFSAYSEKTRVEPNPPYLDLRIVTTDDVSDDVRKAPLDVVQGLVRRLGVRNCVFHSEHALTEQGPLLTDFMTRPGGGFIPEMVYTRHGVDLRAAHVYAVFGMADELARVAREEKDSGPAVAIACLYGLPGSSPELFAGRNMRAELADDERVVAYSVISEFSNSVAGTTDLRAALGVSGASPAEALEYLEKLAAGYGLD